MQHHLRLTRLIGIVAATIVAGALSACNTPPPTTPPSGDAQGIRRTADGKPDFNGVWAGPGFAHTGKDVDNATVRRYTETNMTPVKPGGQALLNRPHAGNVRIDDPTAVCLPNGLTRQIPSPYAQQWIQTPEQLVILYEYMHFFRVIPIGAPNRPHEPIVEPTYMGDSIAWWEDDTLVIDTIGLNEWLLDAYPRRGRQFALAQRPAPRGRTHPVHRSDERVLRRDDRRSGDLRGDRGRKNGRCSSSRPGRSWSSSATTTTGAAPATASTPTCRSHRPSNLRWTKPAAPPPVRGGLYEPLPVPVGSDDRRRARDVDRRCARIIPFPRRSTRTSPSRSPGSWRKSASRIPTPGSSST